MQSLTRTKCGFALPKLALFPHQGRTSIIFEDAGELLVYSIDHPKLAYWKQIGLTEKIIHAGKARFEGYNRQNDYETYLPNVWYCRVPKLARPTGSLLILAKRAVKSARLIAHNRHDAVESWMRIAQVPYMREAAMYALVHDPDDLSFDAKYEEMLLTKDNKIVPIDPFISFSAYLPICLGKYARTYHTSQERDKNDQRRQIRNAH